jgi:hypothetical protein
LILKAKNNKIGKLMMVENDIRICKNFKIYSLIFLNKRDQEDPQIEM